MKVDKYEQGVPSWVDVSSPDVPKTVEFYSALFGWECPESVPESGGYRVAHKNGRTVAGIGPQSNPAAPPAWMTYVNVGNADDIAERVTANGGQVFMPPMDVMDQGRMAVFADTTGAVFGVWQPGSHTGAQVVNENGTLTWNELVSTDVEAAITFYSPVFDWGMRRNPPEGELQYGEWQVGERSVGGLMPKPPQLPAEIPSYWMVYFWVDDVDGTVARVGELGGTVMMPPMDIEPGRFAVVADPGGAVFSVIRMNDTTLG